MRKGMNVQRLVVEALFITAVFLGCRSLTCAGIVESAQIQYDRGAVRDTQGNLAASIFEWRKVLDDYPSSGTADHRLSMVNAAALTALAEAERRSERLDEALLSFTRVRSDFPQFRSSCAEAAIGAAKIYQKKGQPLKALEFYSTVLRDYPDKINRADLARGRLEEVRTTAGDLPAETQAEIDTAIATYERVKREEEAITTARRAAKAKADGGDMEGAKADLAALFSSSLVYNSHSRLSLLAGVQLSIGDKENARITCNRFLDLAVNEYMPEDYLRTRVQTFYSLALGKAEDLDEVVSEAIEALQTYPDGAQMREVRYYLARAYDLRDEVSNSLEVYDDVITRYSTMNDVDSRAIVAISLTRSAQRLSELGQTREARTRFSRVTTDYGETSVAPAAAKSLRDLPEEEAPAQ